MVIGPSLEPVRWVGSSRRHFRALPDFVKSRMGYALYVAQQGGKVLENGRWFEPRMDFDLCLPAGMKEYNELQNW